MLRCLSEGVDIFLKSAERQGGANRMFATGGRCHGWQLEPCPYGLEPLYHFSIENSHPETRHQGRIFRPPWANVASSLTFYLAIASHSLIDQSPTPAMPPPNKKEQYYTRDLYIRSISSHEIVRFRGRLHRYTINAV